MLRWPSTTDRMSNDSSRTDDASTPSDSDDGFSRRRLVATGAVGWTAIGVAGCYREYEPETDGTVTVTSTTTTTDSPGGNGTDSPGGDTDTDTPTPTVVTTTGCDQSMTFLQGQEIGFIVGVYETDTASPLGPERVESVHLEFPTEDLSRRELSWDGGHDAVVDDRWGTTLSDTARLEPGSYRYEVVVTTADGERETESKQFGIVAND